MALTSGVRLYDVLTATISKRVLTVQCLDHPIENALRLVKIGVNKGRHYQILTHNKLDRSFLASNNCARFHQIRFKIATAGAMTDRHTQTDRCQRSYNLSHAML